MASLFFGRWYEDGMEISADTCYRAVTARDARFDGRFFTCVTSTGIYCRPVCPARTPLKRNCQFVPSAAAAQRAGFRPCLRCRPECAPGTPAWRGTGAVAGRALKLIMEGALNDAGVDDLAARAGLGARHLRRLVRTHTGASPVELARVRRVLFAKRLIAETQLPITEIAFASGFRSVRRFNTEIQHSLGRAPRDLRKARDETPSPELILPLTYRPPYDWAGVLAFLKMRAVPGIETLGETSFSRSFVLDGARGRFRITHEPSRRALMAAISIDRIDRLDALVSRLRTMFDLDSDPAAIAEAFEDDALIGWRMRAAPGIRLVQTLDPFEAGLRAIAGQQISVKGAATILGRIAARCSGEGLLEMPGPERLLATPLDGLGLTASRVATFKAWAGFAAMPGTLETLRLDPSQAEPRLQELPGFGPWTIAYLALRGLGDSDAFPSGDLVLKRSAGLDAKTLARRAEGWRPWRAYAAQALWRVPPQDKPKGRS
ncbi:putative bifunctional transcriptional activator/DNA repair enzyme AlkA [Carettochelys insculpta]|uniref:putative bifunctional transcriptional activator/DNA repair enzyme AlkA n=1 Tax=Carettochelys insculpta TaxID=44489 RepID=UPI003EBC610E